MSEKKTKRGIFGGYRTRQEQLEAQEAEAMGMKPKSPKKPKKASKKK